MDQAVPEQLQPAKTFYFRNLLIFPLCYATAIHTLFTDPLPSQTNSTSPSGFSPFVLLIGTWPFNIKSNDSFNFFLLCYHLCLLAYPFLSIVDFTAPFATNQRLVVAYIYVSYFMYVHNVTFFWSAVLVLVAVDTHNVALLASASAAIIFLCRAGDAYLLRLASALLEPDHGVAVMKKGCLLICLVNGFFAYLGLCSDWVVLRMN